MICCRCDQYIPSNSRANQWFCKHCYGAVRKFDKWSKEIEKKWAEEKNLK
jgi:hypothetical protein